MAPTRREGGMSNTELFRNKTSIKIGQARHVPRQLEDQNIERTRIENGSLKSNFGHGRDAGSQAHFLAMSADETRPLLVITVLLDQQARPALITQSHGDAVERAMNASAGVDLAGIELAELPISTQAFAQLRRNLSMPPNTVALYDIFPLSPALEPQLRSVAGQFLAAEALWAMEEQGFLGTTAAEEQFTLPAEFPKDPKEIRQRLVDAGANALGEPAIQAFQQVKGRWDAQPARPQPAATP